MKVLSEKKLIKKQEKGTKENGKLSEKKYKF